MYHPGEVTMRAHYNVLPILLLILAHSTALSQEQYVSVLAGGGLAIPVGPEFISSQWETGYNLGVDVSYAVNRSMTFGGSLEYDHFHRTPDCVYGADRDLIIFSGFARLYPAPLMVPVYAAFYSGVAYDHLGGIVRRLPDGSYLNHIDAAINPMIAARIGWETMISKKTSLVIEGGSTFIVGPFSNSAFLLLRLGAHWRL
jgi:hypothetical protein